MEHEIENLIRQKVREVDTMPVAWRKDFVWQQVSLPVSHKPKRIIYYAAAGALIAGLTIVYILQWNHQAVTEKRIHDLELSIKNKLDRQEKAFALATIPQVNACVPAKSQTAIPKENILVASRQQELVAGRVDISPKVETIQSEIALVTDELPATPETVAILEEPPVAAPAKIIIGYIPPQKEMTIALRKIKKSKIRFLKSPETEPNSQTVENKWITARIN